MSSDVTERPRPKRTETLSVRVEPDLLLAVQMAAGKERRSAADYVRLVLIEKLKESETC